MSSRSAMALRMVAGDRPRTCRRATEREPTGCAVSTYSAMTASSTWRRRGSSAGSDMMSPILHRHRSSMKRASERRKPGSVRRAPPPSVTGSPPPARLPRELRHPTILGGRGLLRRDDWWSFASRCGHAARVPEAALVEREGIGGEVIRLPAQHALDRGLPGREVEPGKAVDEVRADIGKARDTGGVEGLARLRRGVEPIERGQDAVVEALDPEADARDARMAVAGEPLDAYRIGTALDRDLGATLDG